MPSCDRSRFFSASGRRRSLYGLLALLCALGLSGCSEIGALVQSSGSEPVDHTALVQTPAAFEAALKENQAALAEGEPAPDVALFNIGVILAHPSNPKKDYSRAMRAFKTLVQDHPRSEFLNQAKSWIHVLEERREVAEQLRKLAEEKRAVARDREILAQERQRLEYVNRKSLQLDLEIEKRRRSLRK